jgi:oligopeptide/dipeptide ABC transporter ATP-binding protein
LSDVRKQRRFAKESLPSLELPLVGGRVIEAEALTKLYKIGKDPFAAVKNVTFTLSKGEIFGLVGESGSGKSTLGRMLLGLIPPTSGQVLFDGKKVEKSLPSRMQMIFQDPFASLNPRMTIGDIINEPLLIHRRGEPTVGELLDLVGLPKSASGRFPHEFSGGQRQRVGIARALALRPDFIVCDEPISALDVSIQAQIVNLLLRLQKEFSLTYLFIAHDLTMVRHISTRVAVMYQGEFVETAATEKLFKSPSHPYTQLLLSSIPRLDGKRAPLRLFNQTLPLQSSGCPFAPRCPHRQEKCFQEKPLLREIAEGHFVSCHFPCSKTGI